MPETTEGQAGQGVAVKRKPTARQIVRVLEIEAADLKSRAFSTLDSWYAGEAQDTELRQAYQSFVVAQNRVRVAKGE